MEKEFDKEFIRIAEKQQEVEAMEKEISMLRKKVFSFYCQGKDCDLSRVQQLYLYYPSIKIMTYLEMMSLDQFLDKLTEGY